MDWFGTVMAWFEGNLAVLSALFVPVLVAGIGPLTSREAGGRGYRRVRRHAQLRAMLSDGTSAAKRMDDLLDRDVQALAQRRLRKIDGFNLVAIIAVSIVGAGISFLLVTWAQSVTDWWAWIPWVLFAGWTGFVVLLVLVGGLPQLYKQPDKS